MVSFEFMKVYKNKVWKGFNVLGLASEKLLKGISEEVSQCAVLRKLH